MLPGIYWKNVPLFTLEGESILLARFADAAKLIIVQTSEHHDA